jgi:hypothetical protein
MKNIAVIGASKDRQKFGNKCVRAYKKAGYHVFPINPNEERIEGLKCYRSISRIEEKIDIISIYLPASVSTDIIDDILQANPQIVYFNPGAENPEAKKRLEDKEIDVKEKCSIVAIGSDPGEFN